MQGSLCVVLVAAVALSSCDQLDAHIKSRVEAEMAEKVSALEKRVEALEKSSGTNEFTVSLLQSQVNEITDQAASLSAENTGYSIARTPMGPFLLVMDGVTPYLDGYKARFRVGNLTTARFNGAKLKVEWQRPFEKGTDFKAWRESKKEKEFSLTKAFPAGSYTVVEVAIAPATPAEVRNLSVHLEFDQLSLLTGSKDP